MRAKRPIVLSRAARTVLLRFDAAARSWGWESDQGTGQRVFDSQEEYVRAKRLLELFIERLERKL